MILQELLKAYRQIESIIRRDDRQEGFSAQALFETLERMAQDYGLELKIPLQDLSGVIESEIRSINLRARSG